MFWFDIFVKGVELQVLSKSSTYQAISKEVMNCLIKNMEVAVRWEVLMLERRYLTKKGVYPMSYFVASIKGSKGFMMGAEGLLRHIGK